MGPSVAARSTRVFGWTAVALAVITVLAFLLVPDGSPEDRDAEDWVLLPLALANAAVATALVTLVSGCLCLLRRERPGVRTAVPFVAGTGLVLLPVLWVAAWVLSR